MVNNSRIDAIFNLDESESEGKGSAIIVNQDIEKMK